MTDKDGFFKQIKSIISGHEIIDIDYGKHFTKLNRRTALKPKVRYTTPEGYKYTTDEYGRIVSVEGELQFKTASRNKYAQRTVGGEDRLPDDEGGHLIASQFSGSGEIDNLVPMNSQINRKNGKWYEMEEEWRKAFNRQPPDRVEVKIEPIYSGGSSRPVKFEIRYKIGDEDWYRESIKNQVGG